MNADVLNGCAPAVFRHGQVLMTGGALDNTTFMPMTIQAASEDENQKVYCKFAIREQWRQSVATNTATLGRAA